jgi:hypothetical protein
MAHEVRARIDTKVVAHKDLEITVKSGGAKMGTLLISKCNIEWLPKGNSAPVLGQICLVDLRSKGGQ